MADYWQQQQQNSGDGGGQGESSGGTWGWLTGKDEKQWRADPGAYAPGQAPQWATDLMNQSLGQSGGFNQGNIEAARQLQGTGRQGLLGALGLIQGRPLDSEALGQSMMRQGQQQVAQNMSSQLASMPGRYSPAAARTAQMQTASDGQNMALGAQQQAIAAAIQERAARDAALMKGYGALDENDVRRLMAEQEQQKAQQGFWGQQQQAAQGWQRQGMAQQMYEAAQRRAYEEAKKAGYLGQTTPGDSTGMQMAGALASLAGSAIAASDERVKENVRPATEEARALLEALKRSY